MFDAKYGANRSDYAAGSIQIDFDDVVSVSLQGISADLQTETGLFDPVEMGKMTIRDFGALLQILTRIRPLPPPSSEADICPASLVVSAGADLHAFTLQAGSIIYANDNRVVCVEEAMSIAGGFAAAVRSVVLLPGHNDLR